MTNILVLLFLIFLPLNSFAQTNNEIVASVGKENITSEEFKLRFEFSPFISKNFSNNIDSIKNEFIFSLITEKLWALEAEKLGIDISERFNFYFDPVRKIYLRDALFKEKIGSKISISDQEILKGIARFNSTLTLHAVASQDSIEIFNFYKKLNSNVPIDSLLIIDKSLSESFSSVEVKLGLTKDENLEDLLYNLKEGEFTQPYKIEDGWFVFQLINRTSTAGNFSNDEIQSKVISILTDRKKENLYKSYYDNFFKGKTAEVNEELYTKLYKKIVRIISSQINEEENKYYLSESDILKIKNEFSQKELQSYIIKFNNREIALNDFLADLVFNIFSTLTISTDEITTKLNSRMKLFIQDEMLVDEAMNLDLNSSDQIENDLDMWKTNYLSQLLKNRYIDSVKVTDEEVKKYYAVKKNSPELVKQVNIIEIRTDSLAIVEEVLDELREGNDFKSVALKFNRGKLKENADKGSGFFPVTSYGDIGFAADKMVIGEVYGPIKVNHQYSIFKLIDVKESEDILNKSFESEKEALKEELKYNKLNEYFTKVTIQFADENPVKINFDNLNSIKVSSIKMFVHRFMGFGGRIAAVPLLSPIPNLIKIEKLKEKILP